MSLPLRCLRDGVHGQGDTLPRREDEYVGDRRLNSSVTHPREEKKAEVKESALKESHK